MHLLLILGWMAQGSPQRFAIQSHMHMRLALVLLLHQSAGFLATAPGRAQPAEPVVDHLPDPASHPAPVTHCCTSPHRENSDGCTAALGTTSRLGGAPIGLWLLAWSCRPFWPPRSGSRSRPHCSGLLACAVHPQSAQRLGRWTSHRSADPIPPVPSLLRALIEFILDHSSLSEIVRFLLILAEMVPFFPPSGTFK